MTLRKHDDCVVQESTGTSRDSEQSWLMSDAAAVLPVALVDLQYELPSSGKCTHPQSGIEQKCRSASQLHPGHMHAFRTQVLHLGLTRLVLMHCLATSLTLSWLNVWGTGSQTAEAPGACTIATPMQAGVQDDLRIAAAPLLPFLAALSSNHTQAAASASPAQSQGVNALHSPVAEAALRGALAALAALADAEAGAGREAAEAAGVATAQECACGSLEQARQGPGGLAALTRLDLHACGLHSVQVRMCSIS